MEWIFYFQDTVRSSIAGMSGYFQVSFRSVVRGYHVYRVVWTPVVGEELSTQQEHGNPEDLYAVAIIKSDTTVGHIPREISKTCFHFINHDGEINCKITGGKQRSVLLEGGLEVPCVYTFKGKKKLVDKLTTILQGMKFELVD